jgi:PST family polysaccharide transporter
VDAERAAGAGVAAPPPAETSGAGAGRGHAYGQILRSSALIGGSSAVNILVGIVRSKAIALLIGPAGFGLLGLYTAIANLAQSIAGMGINGSGVRQIAAAVGSGDTERVRRTAAVLRRTSLALGVAGALLLAALSRPVSELTFGSGEHAPAVALLAFAVLFKVVSDGQGALVQGLRRIADLARIAALGGLLGSVIGITLIYFLRERGVVPSLVAMAATTLLLSWWYSRRGGFTSPPLAASELTREAGALLRLGSAFMASGVLMLGAAYAVRMIVVRRIGFEAAGLYQAAWTIGGLYVGFVLQAMGADFYPRLTGAIKDRQRCNTLVNEQAQVSLLLAGPGVIATLIFAPLVLTLLYSAAFREAVGLLRWICLGATFQVITWPMGFIIVAEGRPALFFWTELAYTVVHVGLAWALVEPFGVDGAGIAFLLSYVFHGLMLYPIVRRLTGFRWSRANRQTAAVYLGLVGLAFATFRALPSAAATAVATLPLLAIAAYSARTLVRLVSADRLPESIARLVGRTSAVPP